MVSGEGRRTVPPGHLQFCNCDLFEKWTTKRDIVSIGSNSGSEKIAFQNWLKFKESFPPEIVQMAVHAENRKIRSSIDPFGGSGTTALASQFLGISPTTVEVNPFLADLIRTKLQNVSADQLAHSLGEILEKTSKAKIDSTSYIAHLPKTFVEPGHKGRWIFDAMVAERIVVILKSIEELKDPIHRRFYRIVLSGLLIEVSNVTINGKGRRYRRDWPSRHVEPKEVEMKFISRAHDAISDVHKFEGRPFSNPLVIHGDARTFRTNRRHDIAIFSPPYPNSFDYTDVYNVELWMLGYLKDSKSNRDLRNATLSSHVQLRREFKKPPLGSPALVRTLSSLDNIRDQLWSRWIPSMVGAYFADLETVLTRVFSVMRPQSSSWIVVGDSQYGGVYIPTALIMTELVRAMGCTIEMSDKFRSMRSSSQHGGSEDLAETLLVFRLP